MGHLLHHPPTTNTSSCTGGANPFITPNPWMTHHMMEMFRDQACLQSAEAHKHVEAYHTVGGQKRFGLVIDPGAASGLGGTDTKVEYDDNNVPFCDECDIVPNKGSFIGIDG